MKEYSIKNIADMLGTTKNTIKYRMKKLPPDLVRKDGSQWVILEPAIELLRDPAPDDKTDPGVPMEKETSSGDNQDLIRVLENQISYLKDQIEKKDLQIRDLTESLKIEQSISMHNSLMLKERDQQILKLEADNSKRGLWGFFRKKRKESV